MHANVYVPAGPTTIDPASGIVGTTCDNRLQIDYEGNRHHAENLITYADLVHCAADRQATNYPTVARMFVEPDTMTLVGDINMETGVITLLDQQARQRVLTWTTLTDDQLNTQLHATFGAGRHRTPEGSS
ncbi:MAG: hypothetical protein ACOH1Y_09215 [Propionicimonas sp.]